ncbi:cytochrome P450, family 81, subfamily K, polypeptide 2 [Hibiscus trionum]|uniref:Cytochrome P450, family 81, subfamily K, polypeptide 2 n=1 Tax=Hibiscus trionum TaxID=183268 RepID=A0A9W7I950_HIBTR|nr:cytochrome P450, family 81, subfamily K, polypeptide 2 [Hibiscus trionum]
MENLRYYFCAIFFIFLTIKLLTKRKQNLPPSPFSLPIIGHLHLLNFPLYKSLATLFAKYGPILYLRVGSRRILVVSSPSAVEECLGKNDIIFANRPQTMAGDILMYNRRSYVWAPYGPLWRNLRRVSVFEILSSFNVQKLSSIREEEVGNFVRRLSASDGSTGKVDMRYLFSLLTMNVSLKVVSGKRVVEADEEAERMFFQEFKSLFFVGVGTNICDFFPVLKWIGFQGIEKRLKELHMRRDEYLQKLVDGVRLNRIRDVAAIKEEGKNPPFIEKLLSFQEKDPEFFSNEVIKAMALMMFIAGTESTVFTLEWAMSLLLKHPEVLERVRAEIVSHVGHERLLNDSDLANLPYLGCVVNEVLRLYPPAPLLLPHYSSEDCRVGGYEVPKGTLLMVHAWAIHRDPSVWDEPTKFKPERFEGSLEEKEGSKYLPFGLGRRACPGAAMGLRLILLALGVAIQCFEWEKVGSDKVDMTPGNGTFLLKAIPLEALCSPRPGLLKLLSQIQTSK